MNAKKGYLPVAVLAAALIIIFGGCEQQLGTKSVSSPVGKNGKIAVILDTDICDDIDDTWALAMLLQSPEFDVKLITTSVGDTTARTKVVAKILQTTGRTDIPIGAGVAIGDMKTGHRQDGWVKDFDLSKYPGKIYPDGVQVMIDTIMNSPEPITLIAIGPLPNVAAALEREPNIAKKARFVGMQGSVRSGYGEKSKPQKEYNVVSFIKASQTVFTADWDMTITPLDTCSRVTLQGDKYRKVRDCNSPITKAIIENYRVWAKSGNMNEAQVGSRSSTLFDTVAIYLAMKRDLVEMEKLGIRVTDDGYTAIDGKAKKINCATKWKNLGAFEDFLVERLTSPVGPADPNSK
ncbi:MAG: nucleoside hydrolase [Sedimentisphaerales bacterium]|jgi:inosine-uridine nucleoside N-ribohydrolase